MKRRSFALVASNDMPDKMKGRDLQRLESRASISCESVKN
jgi:hypothetical protein